MGRRKSSGHRSGRERPRPRAKPPVRGTVPHPQFGDIPLIDAWITGPDGERIEFLDYDPDYEPPLPTGAVRGDVRRQAYGAGGPRYFYTDRDMTCVQCGEPFVFGAAEQKYWYETLKFHFDAYAIRCPPCRRKRRTHNALHRAVCVTKEALAQTPDDPERRVDLAAAIVRLHERTGRGDLDEAVASARKAAKAEAWSGRTVALFWEAAAHAQAGRDAKAQQLFAEFISRARSVSRWKTLVTDAHRRARELAAE